MCSKSIVTLSNILAGIIEPPDWLIIAVFDTHDGGNKKLINLHNLDKLSRISSGFQPEPIVCFGLSNGSITGLVGLNLNFSPIADDWFCGVRMRYCIE